MISPLPHATETLVVALPAPVVAQRLNATTTHSLRMQNAIRSRKILFTGYVFEDHFSIARKITRPNNYLPLVKGRIEATSSGCILFLTYTLFRSTKVYLIGWTLLSILTGIFAVYLYQEILIGSAAFGLSIAIMAVAWANFNIQLKITRQTLQKVLA